MAAISSVQVTRGMLTSSLQVFASGNTTTFSGVVQADGISTMLRELQQQERSGQQAAVAPPAPAAPAQQSVVERLRELQSLRDEGLITEEQFEAKRADLLQQL